MHGRFRPCGERIKLTAPTGDVRPAPGAFFLAILAASPSLLCSSSPDPANALTAVSQTNCGSRLSANANSGTRFPGLRRPSLK